MKSIVKTVAMMALVGVVALKAYNKQNEAQVSDVVLANVEALANLEGEENWGCPSCGTCSGIYYVCESDYDSWWNDAGRNCSALDVFLIPVPGC